MWLLCQTVMEMSIVQEHACQVWWNTNHVVCIRFSRCIIGRTSEQYKIDDSEDVCLISKQEV